MKNTIISLIIFTSTIIGNAQQPWQRLSDPTTEELASNFNAPPPEYGMILWWGWDGPMTDTVIKRDLDRIKAMGFRGVMVEAGYGMTAKYLSPDWFAMVKTAVEEAKSREMKVWIEDEGKYPSGFAGGKFSDERPDLKMQGLVVTDRFDLKQGEDIYKKLPGFTISAVAYNADDQTSRIIDISTGVLNWKAPEGNWRIFLVGHRFRTSQTRSVNNPTRGKDTTASLFDYLNPLATLQFLKWIHEQYREYFGDEFGKTFMGFMGDEPDFAYTPWTPTIIDEFRIRKGYDITPYLASFYIPHLTEESKRMRADYWDVWSDLFRDNFFKVQADWCRENNIEYIVHLNHEDQLPALVRSSGDYFKNMRYVGVPGVDAIWSQIWMDHVADYPKLASSASHLFGRPRAFTESFAAYTYRPTIPQAKWVLDYQLVRGINSVQIMFMSASTTRDRANPPPDSSLQVSASAPRRRTSFFMSDSFPPVAKYINRATYLLSQGRPAAQTGIYMPTMSLWYGDMESNESMLDISRQLTEKQYDFDFIDEQALSSVLSLENGNFINLSLQKYRAIIIPSMSVISKTSLMRLIEFAASGGKVIVMGRTPSLVSDKNILNAREAEIFKWAIHEPSGNLTSSLLEQLPEPDLKTDIICPQVKYTHRTLKNAELYFIFNEGEEPVSLDVALAGSGEVNEWDAETGEIFPVENSIPLNGHTRTHINLEGWETRFIIISK